MAFTIECTSGYKLCASTSSIYGTKVDYSNDEHTKIKVSCDTQSSGRVVYLPDSNNVKFPNSIAIKIYWGSSGTSLPQEVFVMVPAGKITGVTWKVGSTTFNQNSNPVSVSNNGNVTVQVTIDTSIASDHNPISNLSLYQYYVSKKGLGYKGNGQVVESDTTVGSIKNPGKALHHGGTSNHWSGNKGSTSFYKSFVFTPPSSKPNYYLMIAYKGWYANQIGHIQILDKKANSLIDKSAYWDDGWGKYIRYSFYAVYSDGVVPGFEDDYDDAQYDRTHTNNNKAVEYAMWVQFADPGNLVDVSWHKWKSSSSQPILKDGNGQDLIYKIKSGNYVSTIPNFDFPSNYNNNDTASENFTGNWYKKTTGGWSSSTITSATVEATKATATTTSFAAVFETAKYKITYKGSNGSSANFTVDYNTTLTINPFGNLPNGKSATHTKPTGGSFTATYSDQSYTVAVKSDLTVADPVCSSYVFEGWTKSGNTLTAKWHPAQITVTYNKNGGSGTMATVTVNYNTNYTIVNNEFTPPSGKYFEGWAANADGTGTKYAVGRNYKFTQDTILYAQWGNPWKRVKYVWIYNTADNKWHKYSPWVQTK